LKGKNELEIQGSGFIDSKILCLYQFPDSTPDNFEEGKFISETLLQCPTPMHHNSQTGVILKVSFNNQEWYTVSSSLAYQKPPRVYSLSSSFGFTNPTNYSSTLTLTGVGFTGMTHAAFGNWTTSLPITVLSDTEATLVLPDFVNISAIDGTSPYGDSRATVEIGIPELFSTDEIVYNYIDSFTVEKMEPLLVTAGGEFVTFTGSDFKDTPFLNCKFGSLYAASVEFLSENKIRCKTPPISDTTLDYEVSITLNGVEFTPLYEAQGRKQKLFFAADITVTSIQPSIAFEDDLNVEITVKASVLYDVPTLKCRIHDAIVAGTYLEVSGETYVKCIIPSY